MLLHQKTFKIFGISKKKENIKHSTQTDRFTMDTIHKCGKAFKIFGILKKRKKKHKKFPIIPFMLLIHHLTN